MKIEVSVYPIDTGSNLKAMASLTIDKALVLKGYKLIEGKNGLFLAPPSYKNKEGEFKDLSFFLSKKANDKLSEMAIKEYEKQLGGYEEKGDSPF